MSRKEKRSKDQTGNHPKIEIRELRRIHTKEVECGETVREWEDQESVLSWKSREKSVSAHCVLFCLSNGADNKDWEWTIHFSSLRELCCLATLIRTFWWEVRVN